ncbi:TYRO protein tyrosine kinase-binding protein [Hyperolius riggenbachi]|uniref:TYRO protein tyrosine kinase-binding protein n=1 Tax=Hyperolius riggenbachi TaxID=752182 RepID=UPI0035A2C00E
MPRCSPLPVLFLAMLGIAAGQNGDCENCLRLDSGAIVGIVTCDVIITLVIAGLAFWASSKVQKKKYEAKLLQKNSTVDNDHTYEHLRGQQMDIYTDIKSANDS